MFSNFLSENRAVYVIMWKKYCTAVQTTDDKTARGLFMLNNYGCIYTLIICNIHCFSTAIMVTQTLLYVVF
jgi:hypothetical protein